MLMITPHHGGYLVAIFRLFTPANSSTHPQSNTAVNAGNWMMVIFWIWIGLMVQQMHL
jgi:hypothetical protein